MQRSKGVIGALMLAGVPVAISLVVTLALLPIMYLGLPLVVLLLMGLPVALLMQIGLRLTLIGGLVRGGQTHAAAPTGLLTALVLLELLGMTLLATLLGGVLITALSQIIGQTPWLLLVVLAYVGVATYGLGRAVRTAIRKLRPRPQSTS